MKVLVALDDSPFSEHALDIICHRPWAENTEFKLVYISHSLGDANWAGEKWAGMQLELSKKRRSFADNLVSNARRKLLEQVPQGRTHFELREGDFKAEIMSTATDWGPSVIMMPAHNVDPGERQKIEDIAREIESKTSCKVEVLRLDLSEKTKGS